MFLHDTSSQSEYSTRYLKDLVSIPTLYFVGFDLACRGRQQTKDSLYRTASCSKSNQARVQAHRLRTRRLHRILNGRYWTLCIRHHLLAHDTFARVTDCLAVWYKALTYPCIKQDTHQIIRRNTCVTGNLVATEVRGLYAPSLLDSLRSGVAGESLVRSQIPIYPSSRGLSSDSVLASRRQGKQYGLRN
jgi:hypothetical protein